jgi:hypothetical protein
VTVDSASGADHVGAELACELRHRRCLEEWKRSHSRHRSRRDRHRGMHLAGRT